MERTGLAFLAAEARQSWARACDLMSSRVRAQLAAMQPGEACAAILARIFKQSPAQLQAAASGVVVDDVRVDGSRGYVFYSTPAAASTFLPMESERGRWKVGTISGSSAP